MRGKQPSVSVNCNKCRISGTIYMFDAQRECRGCKQVLVRVIDMSEGTVRKVETGQRVYV